MGSLKPMTLTAALAAVLVAAPVTGASAFAAELPSYEQWQSDVKASLNGVNEYLDAHKGNNASIVLDIDNTALETEYNKGHANQPVLDAAKHAKELGMTVIIISARETGGEDESLQELKDAGYTPDDICLRQSGEDKAEGKLRCRKEFTDKGRVITANIGNRSTDFEGGYFDREFKLPDYNGELS